MPANWDWGNIEGVNFLTNIRNQHLPQYCGSCWAHAATTALSDRIKILRNAQWPDINLSPQLIISCEQTDDGCHGGNALNAYEWIHNNYITDETCAIYQGRGWDNGIGCSAMSRCRNCSPGNACDIPPAYYIYKVDEYGLIHGEEAMMNEIYNRGPIACSMNATPEFDENYHEGIYYDPTVYTTTNHEVTVVGWGEQNGIPFWRVQNSWGSHWGEQGFFRIVRGQNTLAIELNCYWAAPVNDWTMYHVTTDEEQNDPNNDKTAYPFPQPEYKGEESTHKYSKYGGIEKTFFEKGEVLTTHEWIPVDVLPESVDWRHMDGRNYLSWSKNQHIPQYCGSCWAEGSTSALADRFNIFLNLKNPTPIALNAQEIINAYAGGSCNGGNPGQVYEWIYENGIADSSCEQYVAYNNQNAFGPIFACKDCAGPPPAVGDDGQANCAPVEFRKYYTNQHYFVHGADHMKSDLAQYGPIACSIEATAAFEEYRGGIYSQHLSHPPILNHIISVIGYGKTYTGQEYWIGRNSWGTYWGEAGFFRMQMYSDNLGIESDCVAAIPSFAPNSLNATEVLQ